MVNFSSPTPHLFAHRGGNAAGARYENTLLAFRSAVKLGYKFLETDVIVTRDKQVITYHGSANMFMKAIFGLEVRRKVQKLSYEEFKKKITLRRETAPRFRDVLSEFSEQSFCVDVKTDEAVGPLVEIIKKYNAEDRVIVTSFKRKRSRRASRLLYGEGFSKACLCVYRTKGILMALFPAIILPRLKKQGFGYAHVPYMCVTKKLIKEAKRQDFKIYAWTVNEQAKIKKLLSWGIDGIISDEAELLINAAQTA